MKEERLSNWQKILIVLIITGLIYSVFGIRELSRWNREIHAKRPRILFQLILTPLESFSMAAGAESLIPGWQGSFHELKDISFEESFERFLPNAEIYLREKSGRWTESLRRIFKIKEDPIQILGQTARSLENVPSPDAQDLSNETPANIFEGRKTPELPEKAPGPLHTLTISDRNNLSAPVQGRVPPATLPGIPRGESILLVGDSLANSCGTAFVPLVNKREDLELVKHGKVSANLSNPVFDQWFEELDQVLDQRDFDIIILMMGANAAQAIVENGERWEYGTRIWEEIYHQRAVNLIKKLKSDGSKVYWVGIPPMMKKSYSLKMEGHNNRISEICREQGIEFLPIESIIGNDEGKYQEYKIINERQVRIRATDGVHYARAGSFILSQYILKTLFPDIVF